MSSDSSPGSNRPFKTWTFDDACDSMEWSPPSSLSLTVASSATAALDDTDLVVVGVFAPAAKDSSIVLEGTRKALDEKLGGALTELASEEEKAFKNGADVGSTTSVARFVVPGSKTKRYVLVGLGTEEKGIDASAMAKLAPKIAAAIHDAKKVSSCAVVLSIAKVDDGAAALEAFSTAFHSKLYADNRYRTGDRVDIVAEGLTSLTLVDDGNVFGDCDATTAIERGRTVALGVSLTRDIVNAPHNVLNSISMAETAKRIAAESVDGCITCKVLGKEECEARGMGAYLGVARGSETPPQFIHLTYRPKSGDIKRKVGLVGKGLLFDTGGYNVKVAGMELMKFDCGGAAAILGAARATGQLCPEGVEAHFIVAACENMINDRAMVPSDVLTASNGKTIEVLNTDAEGRLTMADALVYADKEVGAEKIVELSTLTGAIMISLGKQMCGVFTKDDDLAKELDDVSKATGDKSWRMPWASEYREQLKSKIADMSNLGERYGGSITAALFLGEFVEENVPFAHVDIAGPVWDDKTGATGFGCKMVTEWIRRQGL